MAAMLPGFSPEALDTLTGLELINLDWSDLSIGSPNAWPPSLRSLLGMMLSCPTPMFLAWGPDLNAFYNDAYRPVLGDRLPGSLGRPFRDLWGDIWSDIGPLVDATLSGQSQTITDMQLDLRRNGVPEESWWSFTYSPVYDEQGQIAGLLCVTGETTPRILADRRKELADERLQLALSAGNSIGAWDWDVVADRVTADERFARLYGIDTERALTGAPIVEFFSGIHPDDVTRVQDEIRIAMETGEVFASEYRLIGEAGAIRWVSAQGRCVLDAEGNCIRFPGVSFDITDRMIADIALKAAKDEREFIIGLTARQRSLDSPDAIMRLSLEALGTRLAVDRVGFYRQLANDKVRYGPCWTNGSMTPILGLVDADRFGRRMRLCREQGTVLTYADTAHDEVGGLDELAEAGVVSGICRHFPPRQSGAGLVGCRRRTGERGLGAEPPRCRSR